VSQTLSAALAGEYAAIYAYGRAGGRLPSDQDIALAQLSRHRTDRDQLRAWLIADGVQPEPPAPAYELPGPMRTDSQARTLLATINLRLIPVLVAVLSDQTDEARRRWVVRAVRRAATSAQGWGAPGQAFPWPDGLTAPA
jgi:hypothetical protein